MGKLSGLIGALVFIAVVGLIVWFCCLRNKKNPRVQRFLSSFRSGPSAARSEEMSSVRNDPPRHQPQHAIAQEPYNPNHYPIIQHNQHQQQPYVHHQAYPMPMPIPYNDNFQQNSNLPYPRGPGCDELPPPYHAVIKH